jgi:AcrR family transcriptional regulator
MTGEAPPVAGAGRVRPRATQRKARSDQVQHRAHLPTQERSLTRFNAILKAAEELLGSANIEDLSLHDVAEQARISAASVHYFFPTIAALQIELSNIYNRQVTDLVVEVQTRLADMKTPTWQDWLRLAAEVTGETFNANRHICETLFGAALHRDVRRAIMDANDHVGRSMLENLDKVFVVPEVPDLARMFAVLAEVADALWARAYLRSGRIDDATLEETVRIQTAYLRLVLPETMPLRVSVEGGRV